MHTEEKIDSTTIYEGRILSLYDDRVRLENGKESRREFVTHNGGVCVLALDENDCIYLVEQFRYPYGKELLEIPAGKRDGDEQPLVCAKRELEEEAGLQAKNWQLIGEMYPSPGYTSEVVTIYLATDLTKSQQHLDPDEFLSVKQMPFDKALQMVLSNQIKDAKTCVALLQLQVMRCAK